MDDHDHGGPLRPDLSPASAADEDSPDFEAEWAEYTAWLDREAAVGREPEPWPSLGVEVWDPELDEPDFPGSASAGSAPAPAAPAPSVAAGAGRALFAENGAADVMPPVPFLAALTDQSVTKLAALSDAELIGVLRASRRQVAREQYKQALAAAEFGRRRQATFEAALARGVPAGCAAGGFPGEELAIELVISRGEAGHLIDDSIDLTTRLPRTLAGMAAGLIDADRAGWIAMYTRGLTRADAARADEVLAADAPDLRSETLARKAAALEMKLNPEAARARKERAKRDGQRVEARREASGNASLAGRELDTADVLASKAYLDAVAARLRESGMSGSLDRLRALALTDLTQGRDPLERVNPAPAQPAGSSPARPAQMAPAPPAGPAPTDPAPTGPSPVPPDGSSPAPVPALINLLVPAATLLGRSTTPGQAGGWGLLDADDTRALVTAAAAHPQTRWCLTLTGPGGTAIAHGCARGPRPHLLNDLEPQPPPGQADQPDPPGQADQPDPPGQADPLAHLAELLRRLNITLTPVTQGSCDHAGAEGHYTPSRQLRHLVRARSATCDAPGCQNPAVNADLDHTRPWPEGPTDQCNLAPRCRTHHRAKQAPDWTVEQLAPGVTRWTLPSGRRHVTTPTRYVS